MTRFCGCDPGLAGGFAVVSGDKILYKMVKMVMPTLSVTTEEGKIKTEIDRQGVLSFLKTLPPHTHVAIEEVQAFRKQNITATCTTCKNYGILLMASTVAHMRITEVPSDIWQNHFGILPANNAGGKTTKQQAFDIAHMIYPNENFKYCQSIFTLSFFRELPADEPPVDETPLGVKPITAVEGICKPLECKPGGKEPGAKLRRRLF
jgi:Holliday junction resolvasome RuvABC endonuclease subunit